MPIYCILKTFFKVQFWNAINAKHVSPINWDIAHKERVQYFIYSLKSPSDIIIVCNKPGIGLLKYKKDIEYLLQMISEWISSPLIFSYKTIIECLQYHNNSFKYLMYSKFYLLNIPYLVKKYITRICLFTIGYGWWRCTWWNDMNLHFSWNGWWILHTCLDQTTYFWNLVNLRTSIFWCHRLDHNFIGFYIKCIRSYIFNKFFKYTLTYIYISDCQKMITIAKSQLSINFQGVKRRWS